MAKVLSGPSFNYVRKVELLNFVSSIVALESDIDTTDTAFLKRFSNIKVCFEKLKIGANYSPAFLNDVVAAADTLNMNLYDVVCHLIKAGLKRTDKPEIVSVAERADNMLLDKKRKSDCTNQRARQGLTHALVNDLNQFTKAELKLLNLTDVVEALDVAQASLLNALTERAEYKAGKERQVFQQACNEFVAAYSSFKNYINDEVATQNNLAIFGKLFVRKLAIIVNEMNRLSVARKNNEPMPTTTSA